MEVLCIGGEMDGRAVSVDERSNTLQFPVLAGGFGFNTSTYRRHTTHAMICGIRVGGCAFVHESIDDSEADRKINLLLATHLLTLLTKPATPKVADATPDVAAPQPAPSGLRWGVRHKATGRIVARFEWQSSAAVYLRRGHAADGWRPDDIELVDLAPEPATPCSSTGKSVGNTGSGESKGL